MEEHKGKAFRGFTTKYGVAQLVWFEVHPTRDAAFRRERQIKEWKRLWKIGLIERMNPNWRDLTNELVWLLAY
jgi:putative endonuclease